MPQNPQPMGLPITLITRATAKNHHFYKNRRTLSMCATMEGLHHLLLTRNGMDFIQYHKAPLLTFKPLHYSFRFPRAFCRVPQHGIRADGNRTANGLVFGIRREATDLAVVDGGPHLELGLPLLHRHGGIPEHQAPLAHSARSRHSHQRLASTCRAGGVTFISHLSDTTGAGGKQKSKGKP